MFAGLAANMQVVTRRTKKRRRRRSWCPGSVDREPRHVEDMRGTGGQEADIVVSSQADRRGNWLSKTWLAEVCAASMEAICW